MEASKGNRKWFLSGGEERGRVTRTWRKFVWESCMFELEISSKVIAKTEPTKLGFRAQSIFKNNNFTF